MVLDRQPLLPRVPGYDMISLCLPNNTTAPVAVTNDKNVPLRSAHTTNTRLHTSLFFLHQFQRVIPTTQCVCYTAVDCWCDINHVDNTSSSIYI
jgi:hypothetical protein